MRRRSGSRGRPVLLALALAVAAPAARAEAPAPPAAGGDCAGAAAERIQRRYDAVSDLEAHFVQRTERVALGASGGDALEASGEVTFAKPGRMRWSYETPAPSLVVSDGETLWIYDPAAREVQQLPLGPEFLSGAAIQFLLGEGRIQDEFGVEALSCGSEEVVLRLAPRREAPFETLELRADARSGEVRETVVVDLLGNRTRVALDRVRTDTGPAPELFRFDPPEGTRVLSLPEAR